LGLMPSFRVVCDAAAARDVDLARAEANSSVRGVRCEQGGRIARVGE
jgi:hypothetical protein